MGQEGHIRAMPDTLLGRVVGDPVLAHAAIRISCLAPRIDPWTGAVGKRDTPVAESVLADLERDARSDRDRSRLWSDLMHEVVRPTFELGKSWHVLHFILCGSRHPTEEGPGLAVFGHEPLAEGLDLSSGCLRHAEVIDVAAGLENVDFVDLELRSRARPAGRVYRWHSEAKPDLVGLFSRLRSYYAEAAVNGHGVIMWRI
jgi:hypothetical protein